MLHLLVSVLLLLVLAIAFFVVLLPKVRPDKSGKVAGLALVLAAAASGGELWTSLHWMHVPLVLGAAALVPGVAIARSFGRVDVIAVVFHRDFRMQGATLAGLKNEIATAAIATLLIIIASGGIARHWQQEGAILSLATGLVILANPFAWHGLSRLRHGSARSVLLDRLVDPKLSSRPDRPSPDLVIVYLEGTDRRFADKTVYGGIYDRLAEYALDGLDFTRVGQIAGTGWSLAGMVATQSGVTVPPRALRFQWMKEDFTTFMPKVTFLGDVLATKGYQSHYVVGGKTGFGGIGAMYKTHQITNLTGIDEQSRMYPADEFAAASVHWFLDDQMVLDTARQVHRDLLADPRPYALIVETIGPHGPDGYLSRRHNANRAATITRDLPRVVGCLIDEVVEFLDDIRARQAATGRDVRIVLLSDHLNHTARLPKAGSDNHGFNTVIFWGDPETRGRTVSRPGSMVDVFPTLLDWLGWADGPVSAGLGRSLLSGEATLVEQFGITALDRMILGDAGYSNHIWSDTPAACEADPQRLEAGGLP